MILVCSQCSIGKPEDAFPFRKNRNGERVLSRKCRACRNATVKAWQQRNPDKVRAYSKLAIDRHAEKRAASKRKWLAKTVEIRNAQSKAWRQNNPEQAREIERRYRTNHPDTIKAKRQRHAERYPERHRELSTERQNRRRARKNAAYVAPVNRREIYDRDGGICQLCSLPVTWEDLNIDHIIPLAVGGTHEPGNVQTTHEACNKIKGAKRAGRTRARVTLVASPEPDAEQLSMTEFAS